MEVVEHRMERQWDRKGGRRGRREWERGEGWVEGDERASKGTVLQHAWAASADW